MSVTSRTTTLSLPRSVTRARQRCVASQAPGTRSSGGADGELAGLAIGLGVLRWARGTGLDPHPTAIIATRATKPAVDALLMSVSRSGNGGAARRLRAGAQCIVSRPWLH